MRVLQQVRACLVDQPVGVFMLGCWVRGGVRHDSSNGWVWDIGKVVVGIVPYHV
jgi:hypothetical protein